ncbi:MAG: N-acetylneuraminate synthase family protein [Candidatus Omnitrophota bacterium]|nr:MAG: N-acetylneuraminate synthase family protein [Candidatus Omnitrophota bacterium]
MLDTTKPYIIGETAYIHEGDFCFLSRIVDEIAEVGLNAAKFHLLLNPESYMSRKHPLMENIKKWVFSRKQWSDIFNRSKEKGLDIIALCDDVESIEYIIAERDDVFAIEIHATGLNDYFLLDAASKFDGFILLGISGSTIEEIQYVVDFLKERNVKKIVLMYGFQSYPTDHKDINLSKMLKLKDIFKLPIGYADHTAFGSPYNEIISVMPAAMGFHILEKHYTPIHGEKRIDYEAAVGKESMKKIIELMRINLEAYGTKKLDMPNTELQYGTTGPMKKAIVARKDIQEGEKLSLDNLWFKRTKERSSVKQNQFPKLIGLKAKKDLEKDEIIDLDKIEHKL